MHISRFLFPGLTVLVYSTTILCSCNNSGSDIPFPGKELGISQPTTVPLKFTEAKKIKWDTVKTGRIKPVVQNLDINTLPSRPYDSTGFQKLAQEPEQSKFDYNALPTQELHLDRLPSQPLQLKMSLLPAATKIKIGKPVLQSGKPLAIYDMPSFAGIQQLVSVLFVDRSGLLWMGGLGGLFVYDGENIQPILQANSGFPPVGGITEDNEGNVWFIQAQGNIGFINRRKGLIGHSAKITGVVNNITKMTKDDAGNIWLYNTKDKAITIIDPQTKTFREIDIKKLVEPDVLTKTSPQEDFQVVQTDDKKIWMSTFFGGVDIIDPVEGNIKFLRKANGLASDSITAISIDDQKRVIWIATPDGLDAINTGDESIMHYNSRQGFTQVFTIDLHCDEHGNIWKLTSTAGIELLDPKNERLRRIKKEDGLKENLVASIAEDNSGRIWLGTIAGMNMIEQNGETVRPVGTIQIISLMEDDSRNLFIATRAGLGIVPPERNKIYILDKAHGLTDDFVQSFWKKNGNIVVATDGGINIIDPVKRTLAKAGKNEGLVSDSIYVAYTDGNGNTWVTGPSNGIDVIDSTQGLILHTDVRGGLSDDNVEDVKQDNNGNIWLATNRNGINVIDPKTATIRYLNNLPGLNDTCSRMMELDKYGRIWVGTDKGIYMADSKAGTVIHIGMNEGLSNEHVKSLLEYNGSILAGTDYKVNIIRAPAPGDTVTKWKVSVLDNSEGLTRLNSTAWSTDAVTREGQFLWGDNGITILNNIRSAADSAAVNITGVNIMTKPLNFFDYKSLSSVDTIWTADTFYTGNNRVGHEAGFADHNKFKWDSVRGPYNLPVNMRLPYNNNYLQFQFEQANLGRQDSVLYTYVLEGIDKNWSTPTLNTFTENYLNLSPGNYTFKVSSKNVNGRWSKPASFSFTIMPPWYQTWWAYTIYVLIGLGLLRLYIVYRSRKLKRENKILEEKVKHRTEQLQKSLEDLKATQAQLIQSEKMASLGELTAGIAHEIQNPLNFVNNFSEVNTELADELKEELNKTNLSSDEKKTLEEIADDIKNNQEKISFHGKRADSIVKGMLQHSRSSNGQKEPTNINNLADEYLRLAYHGLRAKDKSFNATMETDFDENVGKVNVVAQDVGRVILNLITNAFYAVKAAKLQKGNNYQPSVIVSTNKEDGKVFISVRDNGTGIPESVKNKIFQPFFTTKPTGEGTGLGLSLSYDIIKTHGGEIDVKSKEGEGTEFTIQLPVDHNA
ncbi:MAG: ATP-binding protein [Ginsengibacter sp.]